jgi:hypothetical protein
MLKCFRLLSEYINMTLGDLQEREGDGPLRSRVERSVRQKNERDGWMSE